MTQEEALDILKLGHSVYLTGEAGTGKTYVLNKYITWLQEHDMEHAVTASTGIAATHLQGVTIHSWSGIGVREEITEYDLERMEEKRPVWNRLNGAHVLLIDEISMLSGEFFEMLDRVLQHIRRNNSSFGGMQVVCSGDFFQLPPVAQGDYAYAFESDAWKNMNPVVCYLTQQYRHEGNEFLELLSAIRNRTVTEHMYSLLSNRSSQQPTHVKSILRLYTHNRDVDAMNEAHLAKLKEKEKIFTMQSAGKQYHVESLLRGCLAPETLVLKKGAEVMFVKNDHGGKYANGTQGTVVDFETTGPVVHTKEGRTIRAERVSWKREEDSKIVAEITQVPLRLAWAITVHKSQGMTLDEAEIDLSRCFVPGQGYVALSRVKQLSGLYLQGFNDMALAVDDRIVAVDGGFRRRSQLAQDKLRRLSLLDLQKRYEDFIRVSGGSMEAKAKKKTAGVKKDTFSQTRELLEKGMNIEKVAVTRGLTPLTIVGHAEQLLEQGVELDFEYLLPNKKLLPILHEALAKHGFTKLAPVRQFLLHRGHNISYDKLRFMRLSLWSQLRK